MNKLIICVLIILVLIMIYKYCKETKTDRGTATIIIPFEDGQPNEIKVPQVPFPEISEDEEPDQTKEITRLNPEIAAQQRAMAMESSLFSVAPRESLKSTRSRANSMVSAQERDAPRDQEWMQGSIDMKPRPFRKNKTATANKNLITI